MLDFLWGNAASIKPSTERLSKSKPVCTIYTATAISSNGSRIDHAGTNITTVSPLEKYSALA
jgi:hypothetical protein